MGSKGSADHPLARFAGAFAGENWEGILAEIQANRDRDKAELDDLYPRSARRNTMKTLYLANAYGFSQQQRESLLPPLIETLTQLGAEVWEPFQRNNQINLSDPGWAYAVSQADVRDVLAADGILAIVNGTPPDEGVAVEIGMVIAFNQLLAQGRMEQSAGKVEAKAIFLFRDDLRRCSDSDQYPLNLMLFAGLPATDWSRYYYTQMDELKDPQKALVPWLGDGQH